MGNMIPTCCEGKESVQEHAGAVWARARRVMNIPLLLSPLQLEHCQLSLSHQNVELLRSAFLEAFWICIRAQATL